MADVYGNLILKSGSIFNLKLENLTTNPVFSTSDKGRIYFNTTTNAVMVNDGSEWITVQFSNTSSNPLINSLGEEWLNNDLSFNTMDWKSSLQINF